MKRSKNDHIRSTISRYFKRRQFTESEMPSRKDLRREQPVSDLSIRRRAQSRAGVENTLALSSISGDATACDQQFARMKAFITNAVSPYGAQLQPLLFPMFAHVFLEMLCNGHKVPAQKFCERHSETFQDDRHQNFVKVLKKLETKSQVMTSKEVTEFRENRHVLNVTQEALDYLMRHLKGTLFLGQEKIVELQPGLPAQIATGVVEQMISADQQLRDIATAASGCWHSSIYNNVHDHLRLPKTDDNMIMLQVFNQYIKTNVVQENGSQLHSAIELDSEPLVSQDTVEPVQAAASAQPGEPQENELSLMEELEAAIKAMRELPPCLPSICFFTFLNTYQGLCASTISQDKRKLSGCFEDSSICVWNLEPDMIERSPADCDISKIFLAVDHLHCTEEEIKEKMNMRANQNTETVKLVGHRGPVYKTRFLTDSSKYLLSCSSDSTVRLWDMHTQTNAVIYNGHTSPVWDVNICSTDMWFASCANDTTAKLWTFEKTYPLRSYVGHTMDVDCVEFHPNNNYLATGSADKTIRFWNLSEGRTVRLLQGHRGTILALAFSPDGKLLASAGDDRRVKIWDLGTGHAVKDLRGHSDTVYALAFSEDSNVLASGGADCCIRLWDVKKTVESHQSESHSSPELLGAYPTKSALISYLGYSQFNILLAAGASS